MVGIPAECASVLSDYVQEELDLSGIGRVLAVTPNDEVNALTMQDFSSIFDAKISIEFHLGLQKVDDQA